MSQAHSLDAPEPRQQDDEPHIEPALITTKTKDFLGRALANIAVNAVDFLGRSTATGDKDYLGRALVA